MGDNSLVLYEIINIESDIPPALDLIRVKIHLPVY